MNGTDHTEISTAGGGAGLDPREAAALLEQTARQARREFDPQRPLFALCGAGVFLIGFGAVWFSMRNQHPYKQGPAGWAVALLYGLVIIVSIIGGTVLKRTGAGVSGRARRQMQLQGFAFAAAYVGA